MDLDPIQFNCICSVDEHTGRPREKGIEISESLMAQNLFLYTGYYLYLKE